MMITSKVRRLTVVFAAVLLAGLTYTVLLVPVARADGTIFVRSAGDDLHCNGGSNVDYEPGIAPNCAVQSVPKALSLAAPGGTVVVTVGAYTTTIPVGDEISAASAMLAISKSDSSDPVQAGTPLTYTIIVTNTGSMSATDVLVNDFLPSPVILTYGGGAIASQGGGCSFTAPSLISCTLGTLNAGMVATVTIPVTPTAAGSTDNTAIVTSPSDVSGAKNDVESTTFTGNTDLSVSKSDLPDPVFAGQPLTYTVSITNNGPDGVIVVTMTDQLPANTSLVSVIPSAPTCQSGGGLITCTLGPLANGANTAVTIVVTSSVDGLITNTVSVTGSGTDNFPGNNVFTETTTVTPAADLSITKSDSPDPVAAGNLLTYTLTILNNGPSTAQTVVVTDTLPQSVTVTSVSPATTTQSGQQLGWNLSPLNNGASHSITVTVSVDSNLTGIIVNTATVSGSTDDLVLGNNVATENTTITSSGPITIYLPVILKDFTGGSAILEWDGLEPVRDRVSNLDAGAGLITDTVTDGVFKLSVNVGSGGPRTVSNVRLTSTQSFEWDTLTPNANPVLGIFTGGTVLNNANGTITDTLSPGWITIHLYASDDTGGVPVPRFPPATYVYTVIINFTDGSSLTAQATIPASSPTVPPTSLGYVSDVAVNSGTNQIFVASPRHSWVYAIDGGSNTVSRTVAVGNGPTGLTVLTSTTPANSKVFVAHQYGANNWRPGVKAFGVNEAASHDTFDTGYVGAAPVKISANAANGRVYVSNYFDKLAVLDGNSGPPENRLGVVVQKAFQAAYGIDTSSATSRAYLASRDTGELVIFDGLADRLLQAGYIPTHVKPPQACTLWSVAVNETTGHVFVPCPQLSKVYVLQESDVTLLDLEFGAILEEREGGFALVISPAAAPWIAEITIPGGTNLGQEGIAVDHNTGHVFISNAGSNNLVVLQDSSGTPTYVTTVAVGTQPQGVAVNPVTQRVYVANAGSNTVTVLNATSPFSQVATISLTP